MRLIPAWLAVLVAIISVVSALSGITLGWSANKKEQNKEVKNDAEAEASMRADIEYIKRGIDDIRVEQLTQRKEVADLTKEVTRMDESLKSAHKRIDRIETEKG